MARLTFGLIISFLLVVYVIAYVAGCGFAHGRGF